MKLIFHTGVHFTEEDRLIRCLLRNQENLSKIGVAVPGPGVYRPLLRDSLNAMYRHAPAPDAQEVLLDAILGGASADRLILSDANFFRSATNGMRQGTLYPAAASRISRLAELFDQSQMEIYMAIRNPAMMIPKLYAESSDQSDHDFWGFSQPADVCWSDLVRQIKEAVPDVPITIWCNEDAPILWGAIVRAIAGIEPDRKIVGAFDLLSSVISGEGMQQFRAYLRQNPTMDVSQKQQAMAAFMEQFALPEAVEEEIDMPGWTDELVNDLTERYDADVDIISGMKGVRLLLP